MGRTLGAVLCGGASRRMGTDKARLELGGRPLIAWSLRALTEVVDEVVLASGPTPRFPELGLDELPDLRRDAGPLAGLETVLAAARERGCAYVVVLACDMPEVRADLVRELLARVRRSACDALLARTGQGVEPLCGAYSVRCLAAVSEALDAGQRKVTAFHDRTVEGASLRIESVALEELGAGPEAVRNLNTPADLERARAAPGFRSAPDRGTSGKGGEGRESGRG